MPAALRTRATRPQRTGLRRTRRPLARPHPGHVEPAEPQHVRHGLDPVQDRVQPLVVRHPGDRPPESGGAAGGPHRRRLASTAPYRLQLLPLRPGPRVRGRDQDHRHLRRTTGAQLDRRAAGRRAADARSVRPTLTRRASGRARPGPPAGPRPGTSFQAFLNRAVTAATRLPWYMAAARAVSSTGIAPWPLTWLVP